MMIVTSWVEALFPRRCALCAAQGEYLCAQCAARCPEMGTHCRTCARAMAEAGRQCGACLRRPPAIDTLHVRWHYRDWVRDLVLGGKYQGKKGCLLALGEGMRALLPQVDEVDVVVPMPMSRRRLWQRGFNQTDILAAVLARTLGVRVDKRLLFKMHRPPQSRLNTHDARRRNIRAAFVCEKLPPARVLLVDDVSTSGATLNEAAKMLKRAGAQRVHGIVAAAL
ncbi:MAG: ComF family protein [Cardiobacteriaceae bacterium]|nr:ComF family protein [Cardiobacteriaceae bacterium]